MLHLIFWVSCILCNILHLSSCLPAQLTLYHRESPNDKIIISGGNGDTFITENFDFSCACFTGLWAFYEKEGTVPLLVAGGEQDYCTEMSKKIFKVVLLSAASGESNANSIVVFNEEMSQIHSKLVYKRFSPESPVEMTTDLQSVSVLTVGHMPYTFARSSSFCLQPNKTGDTAFSYCIFNDYQLSEEKENPSIAHITPYCDENTKIVYPIICRPFRKGPGFCPVLERMQYTGKNNVKRSIDQQRLGRVFITGSKAMKNYSVFNDTVHFAEDYSNLANSHNNTSTVIKGELWNFLIQAGEKLLGLREDRPPKYKSTAFRLLDLCKKISQFACPSFYAGNNYYDVTVGTFIELQSKVFKFQDTFSDFPTERRITDALNKCLQNFTTGGPYPFLRVDVNNSTYNETAKLCNKVPTPGIYRKYGVTEELAVIHNITGSNWEPIIDTAWQVFVHAHSACYGFFANVNDHHTFVNILMPMFTNEVNDLWYRGEGALDNEAVDIYGFAIGYIEEAVSFASHCSAFSRLETTYPWDLTRPEKRTYA